MGDSVIEGNGGCQTEKFHFIIAVCPDSGGCLADVIDKFFGFLREGYGGFVGPGLSARRPEDQDMAILDHIRSDDRMVGRSDPVAQGEDVLLDFVYPVRGDYGRRVSDMVLISRYIEHQILPKRNSRCLLHVFAMIIRCFSICNIYYEYNLLSRSKFLLIIS